MPELIIDKIRNHFNNAEWDYKFTWSDQKRYGMKYESVRSLAKKIGHPYTSLYLSIHQLVEEEFVTFNKSVVIYERCLEQ